MSEIFSICLCKTNKFKGATRECFGPIFFRTYQGSINIYFALLVGNSGSEVSGNHKNFNVSRKLRRVSVKKKTKATVLGAQFYAD